MIRRQAPASSPAARSVSVGLGLRNHVRCSDLGQWSLVFLHLTYPPPKPLTALAKGKAA